MTRRSHWFDFFWNCYCFRGEKKTKHKWIFQDLLNAINGLVLLVFVGRHFCRASWIDGKSLGLNELCRLKGAIADDDWFQSPRRNDALRVNESVSVPFGLGLSIAVGKRLCDIDWDKQLVGPIEFCVVGDRIGSKSGEQFDSIDTIWDNWLFSMILPAIIALWGSIRRSVIDVVRNEPNRVNDVPFCEYSTVTLHSRSRFCFRSRQIWKAQPTAWLNRSPYNRRRNSSKVIARQQLSVDFSHRVFNRQKTVTQPPTSRTVSTDISESFIMMTVGRTEGYFFDCLIDN